MNALQKPIFLILFFVFTIQQGFAMSAEFDVLNHRALVGKEEVLPEVSPALEAVASLIIADPMSVNQDGVLQEGSGPGQAFASLDFQVAGTIEAPQQQVLNAKLVGGREDIERIVAQMIEKEFLKKDKENHFSLRYLVFGVLGAFCFGVVVKYLYDVYHQNISQISRELAVLEKNNGELRDLLIILQDKVEQGKNDLPGEQKKQANKSRDALNSPMVVAAVGGVAAVGTKIIAKEAVRTSCWCF